MNTFPTILPFFFSLYSHTRLLEQGTVCRSSDGVNLDIAGNNKACRSSKLLPKQT
ncbi:hypothetical protein HanRHA438_Chr08g0362441 [Helianthus annuus]|nr:hypothetical protein HanRHA438_Chr08g0362441 [Helianthus annuus]